MIEAFSIYCIVRKLITRPIEQLKNKIKKNDLKAAPRNVETKVKQPEIRLSELPYDILKLTKNRSSKSRLSANSA